MLLSSWIKNTDANSIFLNVLPYCEDLQFKSLCDNLQSELNNNLKIPINLYIYKVGGFQKKTPIEYIYMLYEDQVLQLKLELSVDPYIKIIKSNFDVILDNKCIDELFI